MTDALAELVCDLDNDDVGVRLAALRRGLELRPPGLVGALRTRIALESDGGLRTAFVVALVRLGEDVMLLEVARALRNSDPVVVAGAARVLGEVGDARAVPNLIEAFKTEDIVIGAAVARALGQLGDRAVVPWLIAALEQGFCVEACAHALGTLGDARALPVLQTLAMSSSDPRWRLAGAQALHALQERG